MPSPLTTPRIAPGIAGVSLIALFVLAGCAADPSGMPVSNAGSAGFGRTEAACPPGNTNPECPLDSRLGTAGTSLSRERGDPTLYGSSDDPAFGVLPQNRRGSGNAPGAGVPAEPPNASPSLSPSTLSGDAGKRTNDSPGGN